MSWIVFVVATIILDPVGGSIPGADDTLDRATTQLNHVATYYRIANFNNWLKRQYPLLNASDLSNPNYHLLTLATLDRNLSDLRASMYEKALYALCYELTPKREYTKNLAQYHAINIIKARLRLLLSTRNSIAPALQNSPHSYRFALYGRSWPLG
jgi:hypothetical protein